MSNEKRPDFPGNSYADKSRKEASAGAKPVAQGRSYRRERTFGEKLSDTFLKSDMKHVLNYVFEDEVIPRLTDGFVATVKGALDMFFYDESSPRRSRGSSARRSGRSYDSYYDDRDRRERDRDRSRREDPMDISNTILHEVILDSKREAEDVRRELEARLEENEEGGITVRDLYVAANIPTNRNYMLDKFGWTNLVDLQITKIPEGWLLKLPRPRKLD